jgi:hypothetical protein
MPPLVKLFIAVLSAPQVPSGYVSQLVSEVFGSVDFEGPHHPFDVTNYYEEEMGQGLVRSIIGFTGPHYADILVGAKLACIELEKGCATDGKRTINLDVGYLDHNKIVLASTKGAGQKIYLDSGIYADYVARYARGAYNPFEWSFPDFKDGRYNAEFLTLRRSLVSHLNLKEKDSHE